VKHLYRWPTEIDVSESGLGNDGGKIATHFDLTALHGEQELTRNAQFADVNGDGDAEIVTRTMNENRVRALNAETGESLWLSPSVLPAADHPQISQLAVDDLDDDGTPEAVIATYDGHVLCIEGTDGSLQWHRKLDFKINNPRLELKQITDDPGLELALTVSNRVSWNYLGGSGRINNIREPSVLVLRSDGTRAWIAREYDERNRGGHNTWAQDVNADGFSEVFAIGNQKLVAFDTSGARKSTLPMRNGDHPDALTVGPWAGSPSRILYTDGIKIIAVATDSGKVVGNHRISNQLNSHLQDLLLFTSENGPRLAAFNIRSADSKMIVYNSRFEPLWAAEIAYDAAMANPILLDWDGDGVDEIAAGSLEAGQEVCSLQIMEEDGTPLYWHGWNGQPLCVPLDVTDLDDDGREELLMGVGKNLGGDGRYSLPEGEHMHLFVFDR
jgi:outer membrane protein assembly factor BamB